MSSARSILAAVLLLVFTSQPAFCTPDRGARLVAEAVSRDLALTKRHLALSNAVYKYKESIAQNIQDLCPDEVPIKSKLKGLWQTSQQVRWPMPQSVRGFDFYVTFAEGLRSAMGWNRFSHQFPDLEGYVLMSPCLSIDDSANVFLYSEERFEQACAEGNLLWYRKVSGGNYQLAKCYRLLTIFPKPLR